MSTLAIPARPQLFRLLTGPQQKPRIWPPRQGFSLPGFCPDPGPAPQPTSRSSAPDPAVASGRPRDGQGRRAGRALPFGANPRPRLPCAGMGKAGANCCGFAAAPLLLKNKLATCRLACWRVGAGILNPRHEGAPGLCNNLGSG